MTRWQSVRLGNCCEIVSGATPSTTVADYWDGDIFWATPKDLSGIEGSYIATTPRKITNAGLASCAASLLPPRSILFSSRAPIGHVAINTVPMATNQGFKSFIPVDDCIHPEFLLRWLRFKRPYLESLGNGATFKEVSKSVVSRVKIELPPLLEQCRIAAILDQADDLRAQRRAVLERFGELESSIFLSMFGSVRDPRSPVGTIREYVEANSGKSSKDVASQEQTPFPIYGGNGINGWAIRPLYESPVLIFGRVGQQCGNVFLTNRPCWVTDNAIVVQVTDHTVLHPLFVLHAFARSDFARRVKHLDLPFINQSMILDAPIVIPPIGAQEKFVQRVTAIGQLANQNRNSLSHLDALFASLQHRAFRGEL